MSRRMLAIVGPLAIVAIVAGGAIAVATNSPSETPAVSTSSSETRTPDPGPSDGATSTVAVGDDDGTADQGPGDVPLQGGVSGDEDTVDTDDGTVDQARVMPRAMMMAMRATIPGRRQQRPGQRRVR